jgi:diguanylate cyclase (GGDEF)-like protein
LLAGAAQILESENKITLVSVFVCGGQVGLVGKLGEILSVDRFQFVHLDSAATASAKHREAPYAPRIIIVDASSDKQRGLAECIELAGDLYLQDVPVIVMVDEDDFDAVEQALEAGATDFIMKPLSGRGIAQRLEVLVRHTEFRNQLRQTALAATGQAADGLDVLTGLPAAGLFARRAEFGLKKAFLQKRVAALLLVNLDHFRRVKTILGIDASNDILQQTAKTIETAVFEFWDQTSRPFAGRDDIVVGRYGMDEFLVFVPDTGRAQDIDDLATFILARVSKPEDTPGVPSDIKAYLTARISITLAPKDGRDIDVLIRNVESMAHHEDRQGRGSFRFYTKSMKTTAIRRFALEAELSQAMHRGDLKIHYQPEVDIRTGKISGAEALVRWQHPELGLLVPEAFIAVAEDVGLISEIGDWVLQQACLQCAEWHRAGYDFMRVAINISPYQFSRLNMPDLVRRALLDAQLPPQSLILEVTESLVIEDVEKTLTTMLDLKNMGVKLALDDFGTGYSSLSYLHSLSIDYLKIDRAFVKELPFHAGGVAVTEAIIRMAKALGLGITAEGVENQEQLNCLRELGCDYYQGYYFSQPVPASQMATLLHAGGIESRVTGKSLK